MKNEIKRYGLWLNVSVVLMGVSSASIWLVLFADFNGNGMQKTMGYLVGILFWAGLIAGYVMFWLLNRERKRLLKRHPWKKHKPKIGFFQFFSTPYGMLADLTCCICGAITILLLIMKNKSEWLTLGFLSAFVFSLQMHGVLNGENYKYNIFLRIRSRGYEKESEN